MSWLLKGVEALRAVDARLFSTDSRLVLHDTVRALLAEDNLVIADVGAAGGLDPRWKSLRPFVQFLTFEPRPDYDSHDLGVINFPVGLAAEKGCRKLHVSKSPDSSSLYVINKEFMSAFGNRDSFEIAKEIPVQVDTLDNCLAAAGNEHLDFMKIDVEGAELEVLKGAEAALGRVVLGARLEVNFAPRHVGGVLFGELDSYLRQRGFQLFTLSRELMIRENALYNALAQPQCVWGDAVYFLSRESLLTRFQKLPGKERAGVLAKMVVLLVKHRIYDYSVELIQHAAASGVVEAEISQALEESVRRSARLPFSYFPRLVTATILAAFIFCLALPSKEARRWATFYFKRRAGTLFFYLWRLTARGGECEGTVSEPQL